MKYCHGCGVMENKETAYVSVTCEECERFLFSEDSTLLDCLTVREIIIPKIQPIGHDYYECLCFKIKDNK